MAWTGCVSGAITAALVALFLMAVGFSIPFWVSFEQHDVAGTTKMYNVYVGVWYLMVCKDGESNSCQSDAIEPNFTSRVDIIFNFPGAEQGDAVAIGAELLGHYGYWWAIQIVTTVGLGLVLLASMILLCSRCAGIHSKGSFIAAGIFLLFGGLSGLAISIVLAVALAAEFTFGTPYEVRAETFPWSALVFGIGGFLAVIASIMIIAIVNKWKKYGAYYENDEKDSINGHQPMSNLSKSYDRPRYPGYNSSSRNDHDRDRYDRNGFASSKKYKDYDGGRENGGYNRGYDQSYDQGRSHDYGRGYESRGGYDRSYGGNHYGRSASDNMYRPYNQTRY